MQSPRPYVLTIAGFDPSAGAGVLADCKTFEQLEVYGFGVCTALTVQTDDKFIKLHWLSAEQIIEQLQPLIGKFDIVACKIGIIHSPETLIEVIRFLKAHNPAIQIIWDPVLKASAGYDFHSPDTFHSLEAILAAVTLVTPNYNELLQLQSIANESLVKDDRALFCAVLLKGGHRADSLGTDTLYEPAGSTVISAGVAHAFPKHGSGCVLAAAITAHLAKGESLREACRLAKNYVETFLNSNQSLLGYHTVC
ncbi:hydroxymethylpyrimidine/phosphomethylpyrimidine kinase [Niastella populi]|uniref:hydroxymethylpyrimidine kinase n=1 Tax=Niastella populi TaxID=550983 RepID=A0A1V9FN76_9BACT|nr:hydroxymethylpyrimidine/phosphomethylpyrimidine kinase [Niastella populi]OQP59788.1 hydroxymethylpyrimidine/phosphomethylpyrimidine kinase [Niastella populi]